MSEELVDIAVGRIGHMCAFDYDMCLMYVLGGYNGYNKEMQTKYLSSQELWIYDTLIEKWSMRRCTGEMSTTDIPAGTSGASCIISSHYLYMFGGYTEEGNSNQLFRLNLKNFQWKQLEPLGKRPLACDKSVCWIYDNKMYLFGGYGCVPIETRDERNFDFVYDPKSHWHYPRGWNNQLVYYDLTFNQWVWFKTEGKVPIPRAAHAVAKVGHKVYIFGGRHEELRMNDIYSLDMKQMSWTEVYSFNDNNETSVPIGRSWHSFTPLSDKQIILYGGFSQDNKPLSDCWALDIESMTWSTIDLPFNKPRIWHSSIASSFGEIIIFGGATHNILDLQNLRNIKDLYSGDIIVLRFVPKSLLRLCLDASVMNYHLLHKQWKYLPRNVKHMLELKKNTIQTNSAGS
ncbi:kelch domain-containing protein 2-like [Oppia nitens]|uniref:kelch domain-containing protein 2-like n=1 Tax=Oppia nitens TaxID=1686743 RepID=UPI0023DB0C67|nr:kelch domain-containing protein 2-like [Oppia nitens]